MLAAILVLPAASVAQEDGKLKIEADSIIGEEKGIRAKNADLHYQDFRLRAEDIYLSSDGPVNASEASLEDGSGNRLESDLLDYFPDLGRAIANGDVKFRGSTGSMMWAHTLLYEIELRRLTLERGRMQDFHGNELSAAEFIYEIDNEVGIARGMVRLVTNAEAELSADMLRYDGEVGKIRIPGQGGYADTDGIMIEGRDIEYDFVSQIGSAEEVALSVVDAAVRGRAARLVIEPDGYLLEEAIYTTCDPADPAWQLVAGSLHIDEESEVVEATDVVLRIKDVPVFYLPWLSYSLSEKRKSGFLAPRLSLDDDGEWGILIPYYLNFAPNYDALASARFISGRGIQGILSGRWLFHRGEGSAEVGGINDGETSEFRSHWRLKHTQRLGSGGYGLIDVSGISDDFYADDLLSDSSDSDVSKRHYLRTIAVGQQRPAWEWSAALVDYQTIQENSPGVEKPYSILPRFTGFWGRDVAGSRLKIAGGVSSFHRDGDPDNGVRIDGRAMIERNIPIGQGHSLELAAGAAGAIYGDNGSSWGVPYASVDLRPEFWSRWNLGGRQLSQLFSPRIKLGLVGSEDFKDVPVYDTARITAGYQDYFSMDSFVGNDRFEDSSFISYGVDSRLWLEESSSQWLDVRLAQRYRFRDSNSGVGNDKPPKAGFSNIIAEARLKADKHNEYVSRIEWNPDISTFEQAEFSMIHRSNDGNTYRFSYNRNELNSPGGDREGIAAGIHHHLNDSLSLAADFNYDLDSKEFTSIDAGFNYISDCRCWGVDFFIEHEPLAAKERTTFFIRFDMFGLGGLGSGKFGTLVDRVKEPL